MNSCENEDAVAPGGVYCCQVSESVSCGACCGLYNVSDPSREALFDMLMRRTLLFENVERKIDAILSFKNTVEAGQDQRRPYPEFHHCPFIGLIGPKRSAVGCLFHPLAEKNKGVDFRGLSYYGGMACRTYFCPSHHEVPKRYKLVTRAAIKDWYLFGLVITDSKLLNGYFSLVENRLGKKLDENRELRNKFFLAAVENFFSLRLSWPYNFQTSSPFPNYFFEDHLYSRPPVEYPDSEQGAPAMLNTLFEALVSRFSSRKQLSEATAAIERLILDAVEAISGSA